MPLPDDRAGLIDQIVGIQDDMARGMAYDRSIPFLATTLTMQQLKTLMILSFQDNLSGHELAGHLGAKLGTVTGIVDRLVQRDLVRRREDPHDRRVRRITLTRNGSQLMDELADSGSGRLRLLLDELDDDTLRDFARVLAKLRVVAQRLFSR